MTPRNHLAAIVLLVAAPAAAPAQPILRVKLGATGSANGATWADAFPTLQAALAAAGGSAEIWVASGTHLPGPGGDRNATFAMASGVALYGGFAGTETSREERDPLVHETVLSGDLLQNDTPGVSPWFSGNINYGDNTYHVVTSAGNDATALLDGFTVYGGYGVGAGATGTSGAGLRITGGAPVVRKCTFRRNYAVGGGGVFMSGGTPAVTDCRFIENITWGSYAGGLYIDNDTNPTVTRNEFRGNVCIYASGPEPVGGAMHIGFNNPITISDCLFVGNKTHYTFGVSFYPAKGGAIFSFSGGVQILRCRFIGNVSQEGGAIMSFGSMTIRDCVFNKNSVQSYDYGGTSLGGWGGAVGLVQIVSTPVNSTVTGCTFTRNFASDSGGGFWSAGPVNVTLRSCIFRDNAVNTGNFGKAQVSGTNPKYCCVHNLFVPELGEDPFDPADVIGSFDAVPQFTDYDGPNNIPGDEDDDFTLLGTSPCIDTGDPNFSSSALDLAGNLRLLDGNLGGTLRVDCGALEYAQLRLAATLVPVGPGLQTLTVSVTGAVGLQALVAAGGSGAPLLLPPWGHLYVDPYQPWVLLPFGPLPASQSFTLPLLGGMPVEMQAAVAGSASSGQLSNPLLVTF